MTIPNEPESAVHIMRHRTLQVAEHNEFWLFYLKLMLLWWPHIKGEITNGTGLKKQDYVNANGNMLTGVSLTEWILKGIDLYSAHIQPNVAHSVQL